MSRFSRVAASWSGSKYSTANLLVFEALRQVVRTLTRAEFDDAHVGQALCAEGILAVDLILARLGAAAVSLPILIHSPATATLMSITPLGPLEWHGAVGVAASLSRGVSLPRGYGQCRDA